MSTYSFSIESMIRGYHVYKDIWNDPDCDEVLECKREPGNSSDPYAVAVLKEITGADTVVGHVPRSISSICSIFLRRGGSITSRVNGHRRYSSDLPQGGLEIPCVLTFSAKSNYESDKARKLLESMLPIAVKIDMVTVSGTDTPTAKFKDFINKDVTSTSRSGKVILDLSDQEDSESAVDLNSKSPQKKRVKHVDIEHIIMGEELNDTEINLAQQLLKTQFSNLNGLQSTLLQEKKMVLTENSVRNKVQIIHCKSRHHWVVASTVHCNTGEVKVCDSLFTYSDKEMEKVICNLFQWNSTKMVIKFTRCQKQVGGTDCGLFAIAFATAIAFNKLPNKLKLVQQDLRSHLVSCFNKGMMSLFPCK